MAKRKPSLSTRILNNLVAAVVPVVLKAYISTCRIRILGSDVRKGLGPHIGAGMHGDFIPLGHFLRKHHYVAMVSRSRDGELGSKVARNLGFRVVRGSSSSGGKEALQELVGRAQEGESPGIVLDGPRGPAGVSKPGAVVLAKRTGLPIVLFAVGAEKAWRLKNWDRTLVPIPFTRLGFKVSRPITIPLDADWEECEQHCRQLDRTLKGMHEEIQNHFRR